MPEEIDEFADDVKRYTQAQEHLVAALDGLQNHAGEPFGAEHAEMVLDALRATAELREFLIRDLGTTVASLQNLEHGLTSLGEFVNTQRQSFHDLSATVAALVDVLLSQGTVSPEALAEKKTEIIAATSAPPGPDGKVN